jgi:hypothetical protein
LCQLCLHCILSAIVPAVVERFVDGLEIKEAAVSGKIPSGRQSILAALEGNISYHGAADIVAFEN